MSDALTVLGVIIVLCGLTMASVNYQSSAERTLANLGYTNNGGEFWKPPLGTPPQGFEPDWANFANGRAAGRAEAFEQIADKIKEMPWENDTKDSFLIWLKEQR